MWRTLILILALSAQAEQQQATTLSIGPGGASVSGGDRNLGFSVKGGKAEATVSVTGTLSGQSQSPYMVVPNPNYVPPRPSSVLTDSETFFKNIGKDYELPPEHRHRRRDADVQPPE